MKIQSIANTLAVVLLLSFVGCATDQPQKSEQAKDNRPVEERLRVGMTKEEVRQAIGNPAGTTVNSNGQESWRYTDTAKAWIPFYAISGGQFQNIVVNFDSEGKVKDWTTGTHGL